MCSESMRDQTARRCTNRVAPDAAGFEWLSIESCRLFAFTKRPGVESEMPESAKGAVACLKFINARPSAGGAIVLYDHLGQAPLLYPYHVGFPREARDCAVLGPLRDIYRVRLDSIDGLCPCGLQPVACHPLALRLSACPFGAELCRDRSVNGREGRRLFGLPTGCWVHQSSGMPDSCQRSPCHDTKSASISARFA